MRTWTATLIIALAVLALNVEAVETNDYVYLGDTNIISGSHINYTELALMTNGTMEWLSNYTIILGRGESEFGFSWSYNETNNVAKLVRQLASEGHICAVFGHQWRGGRPGEGEGSSCGGFYLDYHPNTTYRTCRICEKCESQTINDWE